MTWANALSKKFSWLVLLIACVFVLDACQGLRCRQKANRTNSPGGRSADRDRDLDNDDDDREDDDDDDRNADNDDGDGDNLLFAHSGKSEDVKPVKPVQTPPAEPRREVATPSPVPQAVPAPVAVTSSRSR